jgi:hypothetical protein
VTASWQELLGLPRSGRRPDLYEVLGLDRKRFDLALLERAFAERMKRLEARRDPAEKALVERAREELLRARRVLKSPEARAVYEEDLKKKAQADAKRPTRAPPPTRLEVKVPKLAPERAESKKPTPATRERRTRADDATPSPATGDRKSVV